MKPDFGTKLVEIRNAKGLTQEDVAQICKVTARTIQRIESGVVKPRASTIKMISGVLGFDFYDASNTGYDAMEANQDSKLKTTSIWWYVKDLFNLKTHAMKKISILTLSFLMMGASFLFISKVQAQSNNESEFKSIVVKYNNDKSIKRIEVRFSNYLTFDSLVFIKNDLKAKGIFIDYKSIKFDTYGHLCGINCDVKSSLSRESGGFGMDFSFENKEKKIGFFYDFSKNAKTTFCTGFCDF